MHLQSYQSKITMNQLNNIKIIHTSHSLVLSDIVPRAAYIQFVYVSSAFSKYRTVNMITNHSRVANNNVLTYRSTGVSIMSILKNSRQKCK